MVEARPAFKGKKKSQPVLHGKKGIKKGKKGMSEEEALAQFEKDLALALA